MISRCSCSEAPARLQVRQVSVHQHDGQGDVASVCPLGVSVALCCFISPGVPLSRRADLTLPPHPSAPRLSVRFYFALRTFAVNCLCFLSSLTSPNISHLLSLYFCSSLLSSSSPSFFIFPSLLPLCHLYLHNSTLCPLTSSLPPSLRPLLCCCGPQKRSGQMVSDDFRALLISTGNSLVLLLP